MKALTLQDWITSSGKFPERAKSPDLTEEVKANATILITKLNSFLDELSYKGKRVFSSGFRPSTVNANTPGSAKKSSHMTGIAGDFEDDKDQTLCKLAEAHPDLLRKYGLFMEDKTSTKGKYTNWCHLDYFPRTDRPSRTFKP